MKHIEITKSSKIRLVYILAASHSGSTLLAMLLGSHPEICTVGELKLTSIGNPERYLCSCRKKIKECSFWLSITEDMQKLGFKFDITKAPTDIRTGANPYVLWFLRPLHRGPLLEIIRDIALSLSPNWRRKLSYFQRVNEALIRCILTRTGKNIIVDSSKVGIRLKYLLRNPVFDIQVIRLIRDGRAVALTYTDPAQFADARDPRFREGGMGGDRRTECLSMAEAAYEWLRSNEEAEALLAGLNRFQWTEIRYEDICLRTEETLHRLFKFINVAADKEYISLRNSEHHVVGNGMRLDTNEDIVLDERWKSALWPADLRIFDKIAGRMNRRLGYQ